jgi:Tol biopolymer transport system component
VSPPRILYTAQRINSTNPAWSSDGTKLVLIDGLHLVVINVLDTTVTHVRLKQDIIGLPSYLSWSPTKNHLVVQSQSSKQIFLVDLNGNVNILTAGELPSWSPDGSAIAFFHDGVLCLIPSYGGKVQQLSEAGSILMSPPSWSPSGENLVFSGPPSRRLTIASRFGGQVHQPAGGEWYGQGDQIVWSQSGEDLFAVSQYADIPRVFIIGINGELIDQFDGLSSPSWSYNGRTLLAHVGNTAGPNEIVLIDLQTKLLRTLGRGHAAYWSPVAMSICFIDDGISVIDIN